MTTLVLRSSGLRMLVHWVLPLPEATPRALVCRGRNIGLGSLADAHEAGVAGVVDLFAHADDGRQGHAQGFLAAFHDPLHGDAPAGDIHDLGDAGDQGPAELARDASKDGAAVVVHALLAREDQVDAALGFDGSGKGLGRGEEIATGQAAGVHQRCAAHAHGQGMLERIGSFGLAHAEGHGFGVEAVAQQNGFLGGILIPRVDDHGGFDIAGADIVGRDLGQLGRVRRLFDQHDNFHVSTSYWVTKKSPDAMGNSNVHAVRDLTRHNTNGRDDCHLNRVLPVTIFRLPGSREPVRYQYRQASFKAVEILFSRTACRARPLETTIASRSVPTTIDCRQIVPPPPDRVGPLGRCHLSPTALDFILSPAQGILDVYLVCCRTSILAMPFVPSRLPVKKHSQEGAKARRDTIMIVARSSDSDSSTKRVANEQHLDRKWRRPDAGRRDQFVRTGLCAGGRGSHRRGRPWRGAGSAARAGQRPSSTPRAWP